MLIENIKRRTVLGMSIAVDPRLYDEVMGEYTQRLSAYSLLLMLCVVKVRDWAESISYQGKIAYFFESGHKHASEANKYMNALSQLGGEVMDYNYYYAHAFVDKRHALPLQAADLLAWLHRNHLMRARDGKAPRADFAALARPKDRAAAVDLQELLELREYVAAGAGVFQELPERLRQIYHRANTS